MDSHGTGDSNGLIIRLYSVARGLEDEGQNNVAKLLRAAALSEMYRGSQNRPRMRAGLEQELRAVVDELLAKDSTSESFKTALSHGAAAIEQGNWPLLTEIPRTFVCRFCGEVMIGDAPEQCSGCGARSLTIQECLPVFYLEPLDVDNLRQALRANLVDVERSVDGVDDAEADRGVWPMRDILSHLVDAQDLMNARAKRMLAEDKPDLGSVDPTTLGAFNEDGKPAMTELEKAFRKSRLDVIELADALTEEDFARTGYHAEWGWLSVQDQLTYMVRHEQSHLAELEARRHGR